MLLDESDLEAQFLDIVGSGISDTEISKGFSPFILNSNSETLDSIIEFDRIPSQKDIKNSESKRHKKTKKSSPPRTKAVKKTSKKFKSRSFIPTSDEDDSDDEIKEIEAPHMSPVRKIRQKHFLISDDSNEALPNQTVNLILNNLTFIRLRYPSIERPVKNFNLNFRGV